MTGAISSCRFQDMELDRWERLLKKLKIVTMTILLADWICWLEIKKNWKKTNRYWKPVLLSHCMPCFTTPIIKWLQKSQTVGTLKVFTKNLWLTLSSLAVDSASVVDSESSSSAASALLSNSASLFLLSPIASITLKEACHKNYSKEC